VGRNPQAHIVFVGFCIEGDLRMTSATNPNTIIELHEWLDDHGWKRDELTPNGVTFWRWPINDHIIELPNQASLRKAIAIVFLAADIMKIYPEPPDRRRPRYPQS
jgi:hypothetical protein